MSNQDHPEEFQASSPEGRVLGGQGGSVWAMAARRLLVLSLLLLALKLISYLSVIASDGLLFFLFLALWLPLAGLMFWRARLRRAVALAVYVDGASSLQRWWRGGPVMFCIQALWMLPMAVVLLVVLSQSGGSGFWFAVLLAIPGWLLLSPAVRWLLAGNVHGRWIDYGANWVTAYVLAGLLMLCWSLVALWSPVADMSVLSAFQAYRMGASGALGESEALRSVAAFWGGLDGIRLWLLQQFTAGLSGPWTRLAAWGLLLLQQALFIWPLVLLLQAASVLADRSLPLPTVGFSAYRWAKGLSVVMPALVFVMLCWTLVASNPWGWLRAERVLVQVDQQRYEVPSATLATILERESEWLEGAQQARFVMLQQQAEARLQRLFERAKRRIPSYADWHYSMGGKMSRTALGVMEFFSGEDDRVMTLVSEKLFPEQAWDLSLRQFQSAMMTEYDLQLANAGRDLVTELERQLAPWRSHPHAPTPRQPATNVNQLVGVHLGGVMDVDIAVRQTGLSLAAGAGVAAFSLTTSVQRAVQARAATQGAASAAARGGARVAGRGGSAGAVALCSPAALAGPAVLACGGAVFIATTLAAEYAILKADEAWSREDMEAGIAASLDAMRDEVTAAYTEYLLAAFRADVDAMNQRVFASIRPIDQVRAVAPGARGGAD